MSTLLRFKTLAAIAAFCIVSPAFLLSQVIIRERMEIKPKSSDKETTKLQHPAHTADASERFYDPPLFVREPFWQYIGLTLPSTITISGTVDIAGSIGTNQHALVVYVDPSGAEHEIAAKGRDAIGFGGNMYERQTPFTGTLGKGSFPSISLYLFDSQWVTRIGEVTMDGNTLTYSFSGLLDQHTLPAAQVTATATVTGSFLPDFQFDHWEILAEDMTVTGHDSTWVRFAPMDGTADPGEFSMLSLYRPWGISPSEAGITARVDADGEYAFLAYNEFVEGGNSPYHSGKELAMSMKYTPFLVYADSLGTFNGSTETLSITVTGGGKSATVPVVLTKNEILLGETKYYYVADVDGWPKIKETSSTSVPEDAMPDSEWGEEPVEVVESGLNSGRRLGVYWERGKPIPNATGTLPDALIRLIGRYWSADSVYKVRLSATDSYGETVSTVIEVEKPAKLGDNSIARSRRIYLDIEGKPIDVDSLCVFYGGIHGIPPQFIKGQIQEECAFSQALQKLVPSYRFEPYTEQLTIYNRSARYGNNPFFVRGPWDTQMGTGKCIPSPQCPPEHKNVSFIPYILYPKTLWDFVYDYSQLVTIDPPRGDITPKQHAIYGTRTLEGKMDFGKETYSTMQKMYDQLYELYDDQLGGTDKARAADLARELMASRMRDEWNGVGWKNIVAQTRIASSFGLLQMLYTTATEEREYPTGSDNRPEDLNDTKTCMDFSMMHLNELVKKAVRSKLGGKQNDWPGGFEGAFRDYIYPRWNPKTAYPQTVLSNSLNHMPKP
jgi:hypothetical protein